MMTWKGSVWCLKLKYSVPIGEKNMANRLYKSIASTNSYDILVAIKEGCKANHRATIELSILHNINITKYGET